MLQKINFKITNTHCRSCKTLIESEVGALPGVKKIIVDHLSGQMEIEFGDSLIGKDKIFSAIRKLNYCVAEAGGSAGKADDRKRKLFFLIIAATAMVLAGAYFALQRIGGFELLEKLNEKNISYGLIFAIGLLAGFHCIGMCGGLVLIYTMKKSIQGLSPPKGGLVPFAAREELDGSKKFLVPHFQYNLGRLISYAAIGGILGGAGSFFGVNPFFTGAVMLAAGFLMVIIGLSFIKNWPILGKVKLRTTQFIARFLFSQKHDAKPKGPFIIGLLNGFMPCGPLQAMQLYALTSGDALKGALSMGIFALGTVPLMFGFGAFISKIGQGKIEKIMKISGVLVIVLGFIMFNRGLINFGYGYSGGVKDEAAKENNGTEAQNEKDFQVVKMDLTYYGYEPNVLYIKAGKPVRWVINVKEMSGCTNAIEIASLGIKKDLEYGENIIEFAPPAGVKEIKFSCWMKMVWGKFIVN